MHLNYYFLRALTDSLRDRWVGWKMGECFSQSKDELILGFYREEEQWYLKAHLRADFTCLVVQEEFHRTKRNSVDLFSFLLDKEITAVDMMTNERTFVLSFGEEEALAFKLHGPRSNVLYLKDGVTTTLFKSKLKQDLGLRLEDLHAPLDQSYEAWVASEGHLPDLFPTLGKEATAYLKSLNFEKQSLDEQWQMLQQLLQTLEHPKEFLRCTWQDKPLLSLVPLGTIEDRHSDPVSALNDFFYTYTRTYFLKREKQEAVSRVRQRLRRSYNYLDKTRKKLDELQTGTAYQQLGDLLMANLHAVPHMATKVELTNFYTNEPITIKLKKDLSPQKNAEAFYRKAKNQKLEIASLEKNLADKETEILSLEEHLEAIEEQKSVKTLRQYLKQHRLTQDHDGSTDSGPFRRYSFMGYEILVGKSAKNNDVLTQKYATKEDLWLHAKDVTGSHVVIKHQPGRNYPEMVIERAAELAAYYSKRKTDTLCPVIYTPKKFVRKPKGSVAGSVVVDREEVIMVEPAREG